MVGGFLQCLLHFRDSDDNLFWRKKRKLSWAIILSLSTDSNWRVSL